MLDDTTQRVRSMLAMALAMTSGCLGLLDDRDRDPPPPQALEIAVGATVSITLDRPSCIEDLHTRCLSESADALISLEISEQGALTLDDHAFDRDAIHLQLTAQQAGAATLVARYEDFTGEQFEDRFEVRASQITRVEASVACAAAVDNDIPLAVSSGANFHVSLDAFASERPLATGELPLIEDLQGFAFDAGSTTAPPTPGRHTWNFVGADSEPVQFVVYDPSDIALSLSTQRVLAGAELFDGVQVVPTIDGAPACVHDAPTRGWIAADTADCVAVIGGYAFEGRVPLDLGAQRLEVAFEGSGTCSVSAAVDNGAPTSISFELDAPYPGPEALDLGRLSATPAEVEPSAADHALCNVVNDLSRGGCRILETGLPIPSLDCLRSWEWEVRHRDGTEANEALPSEYVGVGLASDLHARINYEVLGFGVDAYAPSELTITPSPATGLTSFSPGCVDDKQRTISVIADEPGSYDLALSAANINKDKTVQVRARTVAEVVFDTEAEDVRTDGTLSSAHFFVGSTAAVTVTYADDGGGPLGGRAPFEASTSDSDARPSIDPDVGTVHLGTHANVVHLQSDIASGEYDLHAHPMTDVAEVTGIGEPTLAVGEQECVSLVALTSDGAQINGRHPERPVFRIERDGGHVVDSVIASNRQAQLCVRGWAVGDTTLSLRWGPLTRDFVWRVQ